ncbi:MAG: FG-GAP repeat domain-containing protein [Kofleriaceae bacterium]
MDARRALPTLVFAVVVVPAIGGLPIAGAQYWTDATQPCLGSTAQWTNKVDVADLDHDGKVDILLANGGDYDTPGTPEATRVFHNDGGGACTEVSATVLGGFTGLSRVAKAFDLDGDGDLDIVTGGAHHTQLKLFTQSAGTWADASAQLPQQMTSAGDIEAGDVDADGDLDLLVGDWGPNNPTSPAVAGGRTRLYLNDGHGTFTDATATQMPDVLVKMSWDVELVDVDNDWDLDALIACKYCTTTLLFRNDGHGVFANDTTSLPADTNNYDFEAMDLDNDGDLDLATINDGPQLRERILINDGTGTFTDETQTRLAGTANPANADDNVAVWMDVDSDGDADLFIGRLGADRLLINTGGVFALAATATPNDTPATLGVAAVDLDGDGRLDLVQGQGESAFPDKVQLATSMVAVDTTRPYVLATFDGTRVRARVHDYQSPSRAHDFERVWIDDGGAGVDLAWYGEYLWTAPWTNGATRLCARDRRGNETCFEPDPGIHDDVVGGDTTPGPDGDAGCCDAGRTRPSLLPLVVLVLVVRRRRRR